MTELADVLAAALQPLMYDYPAEPGTLITGIRLTRDGELICIEARKGGTWVRVTNLQRPEEFLTSMAASYIHFAVLAITEAGDDE